MNHAHEIDVHHAPEQRRIGFRERRGLGSTRIGDQDIDRLSLRRLGNRGGHSRLIGDIGHRNEMRGTGGNGLIQRGAIAAEHGDGRAGLRQRRGDRPADASPASGDERMRGTRQSGHARASPNELIDLLRRIF